MAKISARNGSKVAEASFDLPSDTGASNFGSIVRYFFVLRSDGAILSTFSWPEADSSYDRSRKGYTIAAKIKPGNDNLAVFNKYVARRAARLGVEVNS